VINANTYIFSDTNVYKNNLPAVIAEQQTEMVQELQHIKIQERGAIIFLHLVLTAYSRDYSLIVVVRHLEFM
jgi:hypothetical protein